MKLVKFANFIITADFIIITDLIKIKDLIKIADSFLTIQRPKMRK